MDENQGRRIEDRTLGERVTVLETKYERMAGDINEIKCSMKSVALRCDVENLRGYFEGRDQVATHNLWWAVKAFIILLITITLASFGLEEISLWR